MNKEQILKEHDKSLGRYKRDKVISLASFFLLYPYKKSSSTLFIKKKYEQEHKLQLTFTDYRKIIKCFLKYLALFILQGNVYLFSSQIGILSLRKKKCKSSNSIDWGRTTKKIAEEQNCSYMEAKKWIKNNSDKVIYYKHNRAKLLNYTFFMHWERKYAQTAKCGHWKVTASKKYIADIIKYLTKNPSQINRIPTFIKYENIK